MDTMDLSLVDLTQQSLNFTEPDGSIMPIPLSELDEYVQYGIRICLNYGAQIGASLILLILLVVLTKPEKRKSAVFILNIFALVFNIVHKIITCTYFTGAFYSSYVYWSGDYSSVPKTDLATQIVGDLFRTFLIISIEASLILQVRTVCVTMVRKYRLILVVLSTLVALAVVALRLTLVGYNTVFILNLADFSDYQWLAASSLYMTTASICFFSAIFTTKLFVALKQRRALGLTQFGPMQIIFIMGCQTLFIPAIFSILQWVNGAPELGSEVETLVALFLPLSAMWASKSLKGAPSPSVLNSKGRSGFLGFLSARGSKFFSRHSKASAGHSLPTASTASTETEAKYTGKSSADLEAGVSKTQEVVVDVNKR